MSNARDLTRREYEAAMKRNEFTRPRFGFLGYPPEVITAAEVYDKAHGAHQKTKGKLTTAKANLIEAMKEHDCKRVPVRSGEKYLVHEETDVVKFDKPQSADGAEPTEDVFDKAGK